MVNKAIEPIYTMEHPNAPIVLFKECNLELRAPMLIFCRGRIEFRWQPSPLLHFTLDPIKLKDQRLRPELGTDAILNIPTNPPISLNVRISHVSGDTKTDNEGHIDFNLSTSRLGGVAKDTRRDDVICDEIKFHIANLKNYIGIGIVYPSKQFRYYRRIALKEGDWEISIDGVENIDELIEELRQDGGFAITHVGVLKKKGGMEFKFSEGLDQIRALGFFLSFAEGRWCYPVLLVGTNKGEVVSRGLPPEGARIDPWKGNWSWSEEVQEENLEDAFWHFALKWKDPKWVETMAIVIDFYIRAITYPVVEFSVLDSFTALDRLASTYNPTIDGKSGTERIASVLSHGDLIGRDLPTDLYTFFNAFFRKHCTPGKIADGATILTEFRNGIVHGNKPIIPGKYGNRPKLDDDGDVKNPPVPFEARLQARELGIWYVEMALLYLIGYGYNGEYNDRLARVKGVSPPWIKSLPSKKTVI
jgi:hypothetical protein